MAIDGQINEPIAQAAWAAVAVFGVLLVMYRYKLYPRIRGPFIKVGGPFSLTDRDFWKERDPDIPPSVVRLLRLPVVLLGALYVILDLVF